jgi:hypothetical protein
VTILRNGDLVQVEVPLNGEREFFRLRVTPLGP